MFIMAEYLSPNTKFLLMESNLSAHDCLQSPKNLENIVNAWTLKTTMCNQKPELYTRKQGNLHLLPLGLAAKCLLSNLSNKFNRNGHFSQIIQGREVSYAGATQTLTPSHPYVKSDIPIRKTTRQGRSTY